MGFAIKSESILSFFIESRHQKLRILSDRSPPCPRHVRLLLTAMTNPKFWSMGGGGHPLCPWCVTLYLQSSVQVKIFPVKVPDKAVPRQVWSPCIHRTTLNRTAIHSALHFNICQIYILKVWCHIKNKTPSFDVYLFDEQSCQISSWSNLKWRSLRPRAPIVARWADRFSRCWWRRFSRFLVCPLILPLPRGEYPQCLPVIVYLCPMPALLPSRRRAAPELQWCELQCCNDTVHSTQKPKTLKSSIIISLTETQI